ncbi:hypothetical protein [Hyphomonas pacifica]|uniref:Uncharacterized protein n=1 Tax=Hyphomonas pacifica TaxID=1280941 RepID=A0A062TYI4_9PROT|nr:hypothetical protein [Hyphomonas pacifica]KCZ47206.1 hypothetical protein HY2_16645 [Hyphomonas pacifica]RAN31057.1 hypothetical protein HY3_17020 [Hyphomonas pacifica]
MNWPGKPPVRIKSVELKARKSPRKADARKQTASGSCGVEFRLSPDLPITEAELQIVETYLSAMIRDLLDEAEASEELIEG